MATAKAVRAATYEVAVTPVEWRRCAQAGRNVPHQPTFTMEGGAQVRALQCSVCGKLILVVHRDQFS